MADHMFFRDFSDRLSFEMSKAAADDYAEMSAAVAATFFLSPVPGSFAVGLDAIFMDFRRGEQVIEMAWDIWSGFIVTAKTSTAETLVHEVAEWLLKSKWSQETHTGSAAEPNDGA